MIKVFFEKYHDECHIEHFVKEFASGENPRDDVSAFKILENYLFGIMRVPANDRVMSFARNAVSIYPDGPLCDGGYWEHRIIEVQNRDGILFRAHEFCGKDFNVFLQHCIDRVSKKLPFLGDNVLDIADGEIARAHGVFDVNQTRVETALGTIIVRPFSDGFKKGIFIDLGREGAAEDLQLALVKVDDDASKTVLTTYVYPDAANGVNVFRHEHENIEEFF